MVQIIRGVILYIDSLNINLEPSYLNYNNGFVSQHAIRIEKQMLKKQTRFVSLLIQNKPGLVIFNQNKTDQIYSF